MRFVVIFLFLFSLAGCGEKEINTTETYIPEKYWEGLGYLGYNRTDNRPTDLPEAFDVLIKKVREIENNYDMLNL